MNWLYNLFAKVIGHKIADKIKLEDGPMDASKPWYKSKTIWTGIVSVLIAAYNAVSQNFHVPVAPDWVFALLGALGVYSRSVADSKIG